MALLRALLLNADRCSRLQPTAYSLMHKQFFQKTIIAISGQVQAIRLLIFSIKIDL